MAALSAQGNLQTGRFEMGLKLNPKLLSICFSIEEEVKHADFVIRYLRNLNFDITRFQPQNLYKVMQPSGLCITHQEKIIPESKEMPNAKLFKGLSVGDESVPCSRIEGNVTKFTAMDETHSRTTYNPPEVIMEGR